MTSPAGSCSCGCLENGQGGSWGAHQEGAECLRQWLGNMEWSFPPRSPPCLAKPPVSVCCWVDPCRWAEAPPGFHPEERKPAHLLSSSSMVGLDKRIPTASTPLSHCAVPPSGKTVCLRCSPEWCWGKGHCGGAEGVLIAPLNLLWQWMVAMRCCLRRVEGDFLQRDMCVIVVVTAVARECS